MDRTVVDFLPGELVCSGGDYGTISLTGVTAEARTTLDKIVTGTRLSGRQPRIVLSFEYDDAASPYIEDRHAGYAGTPERGVGSGASEHDTGGEEGVAEDTAQQGQVDGGA